MRLFPDIKLYHYFISNISLTFLSCYVFAKCMPEPVYQPATLSLLRYNWLTDKVQLVDFSFTFLLECQKLEIDIWNKSSNSDHIYNNIPLCVSFHILWLCNPDIAWKRDETRELCTGLNEEWENVWMCWAFGKRGISVEKKNAWMA